MHGATSVRMVRVERFFHGQRGFYCSLPTEDHEGRWGQGLAAKRWVLRLIDTPLPESRCGMAPNSFSALCLYLRAIVKPGSWQIEALRQCAVWSASDEIIFGLRVVVEFGIFYESSLNWLRGKSHRPYLEHYPSDFKMRELPGYLHSFVAPYLKKLVADPFDVLSESRKHLARLQPELQNEIRARVQAGAVEAFGVYRKHFGSWIYKGRTLVVHVNSPGISGSVARAIIQVATDLIFEGHATERSEAQIFIDRFQANPIDKAMLRFVKNDAGEVRHFLHQFGLIGGDFAEKAENGSCLAPMSASTFQETT